MKIRRLFAPRQRPSLAADIADAIGLVFSIAASWAILAFAAGLIHG